MALADLPTAGEPIHGSEPGTNRGQRPQPLHDMALLWSNLAGRVPLLSGQRIFDRSTYASSDADDIGEQGTPPMQSTQPLKSAQPQQEADPHDVFAIESILAGRADNRAPPLVHDPASQPAAPPVHVAPEISVAAVAAPQVEPVFRVADVGNIQADSIRPDEIRVGDVMAPGERPASKAGKRVVIALLGLSAAIAAAAWQHYGDQAKAMAVNWAPESVRAALLPSETARCRSGCCPCRSGRGSGSGCNDRADRRATGSADRAGTGHCCSRGNGAFDGVRTVAVDGAGSRRDDQTGRGTQSQHRTASNESRPDGA